MQSTVFPLKITKRLKLVVMLIFLIIDFKIVGHVEKNSFFQRGPFLKASFWYFQTATCYNSSLVLSRLDREEVKGNALASKGKSCRPETTIIAENACHDLSVWNKRQKSHLLWMIFFHLVFSHIFIWEVNFSF